MTWENVSMAITRDEVHRLVDAVPEDRVEAIGAALHAAVEAGMTGDDVRRLAELLRSHPDPARPASAPLRTFGSAGALSAEHDLAERVEEILRTDRGAA
jgi:hypothetical protein